MPLFSRKDGDLVRDVPAYRRIMPIIMRTRNESAVYFEQRIDARPGLARLAAYNETSEHKATFFHLVLHALVETLAERPRLNRFVSGGRTYQRRGIWISYSAKKAMDDSSPVFVVKQEMVAGQSFPHLVDAVHREVTEGRSARRSHVDKELSLLLRLPVFLLAFLVRLLRRIDAWNLLPHTFIRSDPLYASVFVANLGSLKLDAAFHHLYEYGNIPVFVTIGRLDGEQIVLRWTFDERVEDGLYCARALERVRERLEQP